MFLQLPSLPVVDASRTQEKAQDCGVFRVQVSDVASPAMGAVPEPRERLLLHWFGTRRYQAEPPYGNTHMLESDEFSAQAGDTDSVDEDAQSVDESDAIVFDDHYQDEMPRAAMVLLDAAKWKDQDHYLVLGLPTLRWKATQEHIKLAYRRKVLRYHPDKQTGTVNAVDDNYFKCIQKAYEFMSDSEKRRRFDSVDPGFDNSFPTKIAPGSTFYETFTPVFDRNAHFSKKHHVPHLGDDSASRKKVESFYRFWSHFESWRSFELLDEESTEDIENREERRWVEKKNKAARAKRKKDEMARLGRLVDTAMRLDPRLARFKQEDQAAKDAKRQERERKQKEIEEEQRRKEAEELKQKLQAEETAKRQQEEAKRAKDELKKSIKANRKQLRSVFSSVVGTSESVNQLLEFIGDDLARLQLIADDVEKSTEKSDALKRHMEWMKKTESEKQAEEARKLAALEEERKRKLAQKQDQAVRPWQNEELKVLIKAINMFPGGTVNRWETIAEYVHTHSGAPDRRRADEIIQKTKEVKQGHVIVSENAAAAAKAAASPSATVPKPRPWTATEQQQLEKALKAYPSAGQKAYTGADRWDKVAAMVEGRTKKEVVERVKEIIKAMKAKKQ